MSVNGIIRDYNWDDILSLIIKDMGIDSKKDQQRYNLYYADGFIEPPDREKFCVRMILYEGKQRPVKKTRQGKVAAGKAVKGKK